MRFCTKIAFAVFLVFGSVGCADTDSEVERTGTGPKYGAMAAPKSTTSLSISRMEKVEAGPPPAGQDSPRALVKKFYRALRTKDKALFCECCFGTLQDVAVAEYELIQTVLATRKLITKTHGPEAFGKFEKEVVGSWCVLGVDDPEYADSVRIQADDEGGQAFVYGPRFPGYVLKRHKNGAWRLCSGIMVMNQPAAVGIEQKRMQYVAAMNVLKKPGTTLAEAIEAHDRAL